MPRSLSEPPAIRLLLRRVAPFTSHYAGISREAHRGERADQAGVPPRHAAPIAVVCFNLADGVYVNVVVPRCIQALASATAQG